MVSRGKSMNRYNELKVQVLAFFASTQGEWLGPQEAAEKLDFFPARSDEATKDPAAITCQMCSKMGDAVIASALNPAWKLHSIDTVHAPIAEALKLEYQIHPGEKALARRTAAPAASAPHVPPAP